MKFILVIFIITQLQQYATSVNIVHKAGSNFPTKFKVPAGVYELRRIEDDELGSIKSDRIVTVEQDQPIMKTGGVIKTAYQHLKRQHVAPESHSSGVMSLSSAGDGQDYVQRGYQSDVVTDSRHNYMQRQREYLNQNAGPSAISPSGSGISKQAHRGYQALQATEQNDNSLSGLVSAPGGQHYIQSSQGAQQDLSKYQVVNDNSEGVASITLPGNYQHHHHQQHQHQHQSQQIPEGYEVVNEGPAAHVVSLPANYQVANGNNDYSGSGAGPLYSQAQNEAYTAYGGSYIPQNQQAQVQYEARKSQHVPIQMPLSFVGGIEGIQQQGQLWNMIRSSRSNSSPRRPYERQPKQCKDVSRSE